MSDFTIRAADLCEPDDGAVNFAIRVVAAALEAARAHAKVVISMDAMTGVSSSFFNVIFMDLKEKLGPEGARERVRFAGLTKMQSLIADRSRSAVLDG